MADAHWKVGTITVPAAAGSTSVTGLGGTPKAVFFYGTNFLTEDSVVTSAATGLFRGMAAPQYNAPGTIVQSAASVIPAGNAHGIYSNAVRMINTSGLATTLYGASLTSFDADGFTLGWFTAAAGGYKVIYIALMDVTNVGAFKGTTNQASLAFGWKAGASLLHGAWAGPDITGNDRTQEFYGGAAYPGTSVLTWEAAGLTAFTFPTSASAQYNIGIYDQAPNIVVAQGGSFIGPFLNTSNILAHPVVASQTNFTFTGDASDGGMVTAWDDEASQTGRLTPPASQGNTTTVSGLPFAPGLLIGYSISNEPPGQSTGGRGAVGFSVVTPDFQWTALVDGKAAQGAFQSFQRGVADSVSGFDVTVHAGTIDLTNDGFVVTTEEDSMAPETWVWHVFGHPETQFQWIPHIYRRILG